MRFIDVPIDQIDFGERRRQDLGDISGLAKGIQRVGLLEPIIVDRNGKNDRYRLVAGERRLQAVRLLKRKTIAAQLLEHLSDAELRDIELEENENRKALTERERTRSFASSKKIVENAKRAQEVIGRTPKTPHPKGGRPTKGTASQEEIAQALATSPRDLVRAEQHVETAERFPFMQGGDWRQSDVLRVRERLEELPEQERHDAAGVLECAKLLDPALAVELVENIAAKKPAERQEVYRLSQSADPRDRSLALTKAAELPPMPDPRLGILDNACSILKAAIKPFPKDPLTPRISHLRDELRKVRGAVKEVSFDAQKQKGTVQ